MRLLTHIAFCLAMGVPALAADRLPRLSFPDPGPLDMGSHAVGELIEKTIVIKNLGGSPANLDIQFDGGLVFRFKDDAYPGEGGTCDKNLSHVPGQNECSIVIEGSVIWPYKRTGQLIVQHQGGRLTKDLTISGLVNQHPPVASNGHLETLEDKPVTGKFLAEDPDGDTLAYTILQDGKKGHLQITDPEKGTFSYVPNKDESGNDSILYSVTDGDSESKPARVTVAIVPVNDTPVAHETEFTTTIDKPYTGTVSAQDEDNDKLTFSVLKQGNLGTATITDQVSGTFTYIPNNGVSGPDEFSFQASDGKSTSLPATAKIKVVSDERHPVVDEEIKPHGTTNRDVSSESVAMPVGPMSTPNATPSW